MSGKKDSEDAFRLTPDMFDLDSAFWAPVKAEVERSHIFSGVLLERHRLHPSRISINPVTLGKRLGQYRKFAIEPGTSHARNWTIQELARKTGIHRQRLSSYEAGNVDLTVLNEMMRIGMAMEMSLVDVFEFLMSSEGTWELPLDEEMGQRTGIGWDRLKDYEGNQVDLTVFNEFIRIAVVLRINVVDEIKNWCDVAPVTAEDVRRVLEVEEQTRTAHISRPVSSSKKNKLKRDDNRQKRE